MSNSRRSRPVAEGLIPYVAAVAGVAATTAIIELIPGADHVGTISLLYLLVVIATAYRFGRGPSVCAALLAVVFFNWFFVEPRYTLTANNPAEWVTLGAFLITALVISHLTQNLRLRAEEARQREIETAALARASWAVASQVSYQNALTEVLRQMAQVAHINASAILVEGVEGEVEVVASHGNENVQLPRFESRSRELAEIFEGHAFSASNSGDSTTDLYSPLFLEKRVVGALYLHYDGREPLQPEARRVVESLANHAAVALERHHLMEAEAKAGAVVEADRLKTALLSMVSHDFRSPLAGIKASITSLLQEGQPWEASLQRELLTGIDQETDRLNRMVGEILALSRLEAGAWRPQCEPVDIAEVVGAALDGFSASENQRINVDLTPGLPEVSLDSVQIVQVLHNLLDNALKYSPTTEAVDLRVRCSPGVLVVEVMDRGHGLPLGEEELIFERFYRATIWRESALPGSGIGLAICRGLAEAHGGKLTAANRAGGGAVFTMELPLEASGGIMEDVASL